MKKQICLLLAVLCISGLFSACHFESVAEHESRLATPVSSGIPTKEPSGPADGWVAAETSAVQERGSLDGGTSRSAGTNRTTSPATAKNSGAPAGGNGIQHQKTEAAQAAPQPSDIQVTLSVTCNNAIGNANPDMNLPKDGVILREVSITLKSGQSVFEALNSACRAHGVYLGYQNSAYGKYVTGIGPLGEKDCGRQSGWTYQVNGVTPSKSADAYKLKNGDNIQWIYEIHA